ncbi:hypothetical protein [Streptomyces rubiginosohelvolus]|uniref:hypothetical protein n=1 Tax=Streptomyces rubiginosohelvolus TaxID=67362 RepID=UPI00382EB372
MAGLARINVPNVPHTLKRRGIDGLTWLGTIADRLMLRTGGCEDCALSGTCRVCRPLVKHYQEALGSGA